MFHYNYSPILDLPPSIYPTTRSALLLPKSLAGVGPSSRVPVSGGSVSHLLLSFSPVAARAQTEHNHLRRCLFISMSLLPCRLTTSLPPINMIVPDHVVPGRSYLGRLGEPASPPAQHLEGAASYSETATGCRDGSSIATRPRSWSPDALSPEFRRRLHHRRYDENLKNHQPCPAIATTHRLMMMAQDTTAGHSTWSCSTLDRRRALIQARSLRVDASTNVVPGSLLPRVSSCNISSRRS